MKTACIPVLGILIACLCVSFASAANTTDTFNTAGALYTKSVDLAEAGNYTEALAAADAALSYNETSLTALIQAQRSGLLVELGRYTEAVEAADAAIAVQGNLTVAHSVAYFNKGNALLRLGKTSEAREAYAKAHELDSSLVSPVPPTTTPATSPLSAPGAIVAGACGALLFLRLKKS